MNNSWPNLKNPPVIMAIFQLRFEKGAIPITDYLKYERELQHSLPKRKDNIEANIDIPNTIAIGISKIESTSNARLTSYTFFSENQKIKLLLGGDVITLSDENKYEGWDNFNGLINKYLSILSPLLEQYTVRRLSIRFINRFVFDSFDNPTEYIKTTISSTEKNGFSFPVMKYGFNIMLQIPEKNAYSIVNQNIETPSINNYFYIFDIDVLEKINLIFDIQSIMSNLNELRNIKNKIFFDNLTDKTIGLCN